MRACSTPCPGTSRRVPATICTNSIEYLDGTSAQKLPEAREGRLLLSFREIGTLAIFDPATDEIVWTMRGPWLRQHDPDLLANGNILLFDNQGNVGPGGITRVIEVDPKTHKIVWTYAGTPEEPFESEVRSSQARLPNGNTLITEVRPVGGCSRSPAEARSSGTSSIRCAASAATDRSWFRSSHGQSASIPTSSTLRSWRDRPGSRMSATICTRRTDRLSLACRAIA